MTLIALAILAFSIGMVVGERSIWIAHDRARAMGLSGGTTTENGP